MTPPPPAKRQRRNALRPGSAEIETLREVGALYGLERFGVGNELQVTSDELTVDASESEDGTSSGEEKEEASDVLNEEPEASIPVSVEEEKSEKHEKPLGDDEK